MEASSKNASDEKRMAALAAHQIFHGCAAWQLRILAKLGRLQSFKKFSTIFREGGRASAIYILTHGAIEFLTGEGGVSFIRVRRERSF